MIKKNLADVFERYMLCKEFGWLPSQMENEELRLMQDFAIIIQEIHKLDKEDMNRMKSESEKIRRR